MQRCVYNMLNGGVYETLKGRKHAKGRPDRERVCGSGLAEEREESRMIHQKISLLCLVQGHGTMQVMRNKLKYRGAGT